VERLVEGMMTFAKPFAAVCCLALTLAVLACQTALADPAPTVEVDFRSTQGGTHHFADELRLSAAGQTPLILKSDIAADRLQPLPGPQFPIGNDHVLLLGVSSYGSGMESLHALLLQIANGQVTLQQELRLTSTRASSVLLVRRAGADTILLGIPERIDCGNEPEACLAYGPAKTGRLDAHQIEELRFVAEDRHETDLVFSWPFEKPYPERVGWLSVTRDGVAVPPRSSPK
jgi:hypothetical protein